MLLLNQIAQGAVPIETEIARLAGESLESRAATFDQLLFMNDQAGANADDVRTAMLDAGMVSEPDASLLPMREELRRFKRTYPPQVLDQFEPNFRFLISLLRIADGRRRAECGKNCGHWWHADLSDPAVLKQFESPPRRWWQFWR